MLDKILLEQGAGLGYTFLATCVTQNLLLVGSLGRFKLNHIKGGPCV